MSSTYQKTIPVEAGTSQQTQRRGVAGGWGGSPCTAEPPGKRWSRGVVGRVCSRERVSHSFEGRFHRSSGRLLGVCFGGAPQCRAGLRACPPAPDPRSVLCPAALLAQVSPMARPRSEERVLTPAPEPAHVRLFPVMAGGAAHSPSLRVAAACTGSLQSRGLQRTSFHSGGPAPKSTVSLGKTYMG